MFLIIKDNSIHICLGYNVATPKRLMSIATIVKEMPRKTTVILHIVLMSRKCGSLDVSQTYGPPRPVTGISLPLPFLHCTNKVILHSGSVDANHVSIEFSTVVLDNF
jgi:hypothetical protein